MEDRRFALDLNLDQVFGALNAGREELDLLSVYYSPLDDLDAVAYRHEVLKDLERPACLAAVRAFGQAMHQVRDVLATMRTLHNRWQTQRLFVDAVSAYCGAVTSLASALSELGPRCAPWARSANTSAITRLRRVSGAGRRGQRDRQRPGQAPLRATAPRHPGDTVSLTRASRTMPAKWRLFSPSSERSGQRLHGRVPAPWT